MEWNDLIQEATMKFGFAEGTGLGAVLLALVILGVSFSPIIRAKSLQQVVRYLFRRK
jgi:hypothetical protein